MLEAVKPQATENFASLGHGWILEVANHLVTASTLPEGIKSTLEGAKSTGSRIVNQRKAGERLRKVREGISE